MASAADSASTSTSPPNDGFNPVEKSDGANPPNLTVGMLTGLNIDEYFARTNSSGTTSYLTSRQGSTIAIANRSSLGATPAMRRWAIRRFVI